MNCKPGDLAVYVGRMEAHLGEIVRCVEFVGVQPIVGTARKAPMWRIDRPFRHSRAVKKDWIADHSLRPIRPGDISDEEVRDLYAPELLEATND